MLPVVNVGRKSLGDYGTLVSRGLMEEIRRLAEQLRWRYRMRRGEQIRTVFRNVATRARLIVGRPLLYVLWYRDVRDGASRERSLDRLVDDVHDVRGTHDALIVRGDVDEELVEVDVLLVMRADEIVKCVARDREHGLTVALRVVEAVQQVNAARARCRETDAKAAGVLRVAASSERCRLFVSHLNEAHALLVRAQRLENAVDAIAGEAEHRVHTPRGEPLDEQIRRRCCHIASSRYQPIVWGTHTLCPVKARVLDGRIVRQLRIRSTSLCPKPGFEQDKKLRVRYALCETRC